MELVSLKISYVCLRQIVPIFASSMISLLFVILLRICVVIDCSFIYSVFIIRI